jgi:hypothetical protein
MKKIPRLLILIVSFNFISCYTAKYYATESRYPDESEYFNIKVWALDMDKIQGHPFFMLQIENKKNKNILGKNITIEEIKIYTKDIIYDMKYYINEISFLYNRSPWYNLTNQEITNFLNTSSIDFPIQTDEIFFRYCMIYGRNPGIKFSKYSNLTLFLKIKIELEDGTIEQITIEKHGKREHIILPSFIFWFGSV